MCVAPRFLVGPLSMLMWEVMVLYVDVLPSGRASWFMYGSHVECIFYGLYVMALGSFLCSWVIGRIRVVMSVNRASSRLLLMRFWSPLLSLACIAFVLSM